MHARLGVFGFLLASLFACAVPPADPGDPPPDETPTTAKKSSKDKTTNVDDVLTPVEAAQIEQCSNVCPEGAKRCAASASAGTEVCAKGADGCLAWTQGVDCAAGSSCDRSANDGSCVAGCKNDAGCSAANVNAQVCSVEGGRSRIQCSKVGSCFQWTAVMSCSPDEACQGGSCEPRCTDACTLGALQCTGSRSRQQCTKAASGCTEWTATTGCSPDEVCSAGTCQ